MSKPKKLHEKSVEEQKLSAIVQKILDERSGVIRVSPAWVATEAMVSLDPNRISPPEVYTAAHLQFRQVARGLLRDAADPESTETAVQDEMFPDLQKRYPAAHKRGTEPEYVLLERLSKEDWEFNLQRMRRATKQLQNHADAFEAWGKSRFVQAA